MAAVATRTATAQAGPGARCPEAQADGVPCTCLGLACEECSRAYPAVPAPAATADPDDRAGRPHA